VLSVYDLLSSVNELVLGNGLFGDLLNLALNPDYLGELSKQGGGDRDIEFDFFEVSSLLE
jgi:hypothetical protein